MKIEVRLRIQATATESYETLPAADLENGRVRVLNSPGAVLGLAAGDEIAVGAGGAFEVLARSGNLCIQIIRLAGIDAASIARFEAAAIALGGRLDATGPKLCVLTVPASAGIATISSHMDRACAACAADCVWMFGNAYEVGDGATPMDWVRPFLTK